MLKTQTAFILLRKQSSEVAAIDNLSSNRLQLLKSYHSIHRQMPLLLLKSECGEGMECEFRAII